MNTKQYSIPYCLTILFFECCYMLPFVKVFVNIPTTSYISFAVAIMLFNRETISKVLTKSILIAIPFILLYFIVARQLNFFYGFLHPLLLLWYSLFPAILACDLIKRNKKTEINFTVIVSLVLFAYVAVNTLTELQTNEYVLRDITSGRDEELLDQMVLRNVGGFGFAYASGVFFIALLTIIVNSQIKKNYKTILSLFSVLLFFIVIRAQFTTLLFIVLSLSFLILYLRSNKSMRIAIVILSPFLVFGISFLLTLLMSLYEGSVVGDHLQTFYNSIWENNSVVDSAGMRSNYMADAIWTGLSSPIWGQGIVSGPVYYIARHCHSDILAAFVGTGIIGVYSRYKSLVFVSKKSNEGLGKNLSKRTYIPIILYYLLLSFFNPIEQIGEVAWTSFLITPVVYHLNFKYLSHE